MSSSHTGLYVFIYLFFALPLCCAVPCPNGCSSHGLCNSATATCSCFNGFEGPDCSLLSCPIGPAWSDMAIGKDLAHQPSVCSNMVPILL